MTEQEKKLTIAARRKNHQFGNRAGQSGQKSTYKSKVIGLEEDTFDVGASSDPAKFSKSLKTINNYIQKTYKMPDDIVKAIQQMKRPTLPYPEKPTKVQCVYLSRQSHKNLPTT
jgi:hypothetical protein